jgi:hypothetical protein
MPALVNISVGSLRGTSGPDGTGVCAFCSKKPRKWDRMSLTEFMRGTAGFLSRERRPAGRRRGFYSPRRGNVQ